MKTKYDTYQQTYSQAHVSSTKWYHLLGEVCVGLAIIPKILFNNFSIKSKKLEQKV